MITTNSLYFVMISLALFSASTLADVYKWIDKHGQTHFSEKPPSEQASEKVDVKVDYNTGSTMATENQIQLLHNDISQSQDDERQEKTRIKRQERELELQCENMRKKLEYVLDYMETKWNERDERSAAELRFKINQSCD